MTRGIRAAGIAAMGPVARLKRRADHWALRLKVSPRIVRVQRMRRKWGSCTDRGIVTLAIDLDRQDAGFQDFVIAHELLHLRLPNHGKLFKALMSAHVPRWRKYEEAGRGSRAVTGPKT